MKRLIIISLLVLNVSTALSWGGKGHDIVASVAENNLTPKAKKKLNELLDGRSIIVYSSWMDALRGDSRYNHTSTWHYANVDDGFTYETMKKNPAGDVLTATNEAIAKLKGGGLSDSLEKMYVKYLVHLVGDMHCPMHAGRLSDRGGNDVKITFMGKVTSLHSLWDDQIVEAAKKWSYSEWSKHIDYLKSKDKKTIQSSRPEDWMYETVVLSKSIYDATPANSKLSYDYTSRFTPLVESQLMKSGLRLAAILNSIYK